MRLRAAPTLAVLVGAAVFAVLPSLISDFRTQELARVGIYFVAIVGLQILTGYTGQISLGHGAFMMIGAYTTAILTTRHDWNDLLTIPVAGLVAGAVGFLFGFPALRFSGVYLALATFAIPLAGISIAKKYEGFTGGGGGIVLGQPKAELGLDVSRGDWLYYLTWTVAGILLLAAFAILAGRSGRAFRAVRDSEIAAVSSGVNLAVWKTLAFGISAFYAGVAGSLLAIWAAYVNPDTFPISESILLLVGVVVAGLGSLSGVVVGALFVFYVPLYSSDILDWVSDKVPYLSVDARTVGVPSVVYGVILLLVLFVLPSGVGGVVRLASGKWWRRLRKGRTITIEPVAATSQEAQSPSGQVTSPRSEA